LDNPNPYGLTDSEKVILKNKTTVKKLDRTISKTQLQINSLKEKMEGVTTVVDGQNQRINKLQTRILDIEESLKKSFEMYQETQKRLDGVEALTKELKETQDKNYKQITKVLKELGKLIDKIDNSYVKRSEIEGLVKKSAATTKSAKKSKLKKDSPTLLKDAVNDFRSKKYEDAKSEFAELIKRRYKPARCNYYLGEISYYTKKYSDAVAYYKKSLSLYDKANYVPTLLFHTAISFEKMGKKSEAKKFYLALEANYPDSTEAKMAKKKLNKE
jgi:TolA-binding protein